MLSLSAQSALIEAVTNRTQLTVSRNLLVQLHTDDPGPGCDQNVAQLDARSPITLRFGPLADQVENALPVVWNSGLADETITHCSLWDGAGVPWIYGMLPTAVTTTSLESSLQLAAGSLVLDAFLLLQLPQITSGVVYPLAVLLPTEPTTTDLFAAVKTAIEADVDLVAAFGRTGFLYFALTGPRESLPRAIWADVDNEAEVLLSAGRQAVISGHAQITVYAASRRAAKALSRQLARTIEAAAEAGDITCDDWGTVQIARGATPLDMSSLDPEKGPDGGDVWAHVIQYSFLAGEADSYV